MLEIIILNKEQIAVIMIHVLLVSTFFYYLKKF